MRSLLPVGLLLAACGGGRATGSPAAVASPEPSAPAPIENRVAASPDCPGTDELVVLPSPPIAASWSGATSSSGEGTIDVRWCGELDADVLTLVALDGAGAWKRTFEPGAQPLRRGTTARLPVSGRPYPTSSPVTITALRVDGVEVTAHGTLHSVDDPRLVAAKAACVQCNGTWAARGMSGRQACDCPTHDAGKRCTSDRDCESVCLATAWEPTAATAADRCAPAATLELVGRCHSRQVALGCLARVSTGQRACDDGLARRLPMVCAD